MLGPTYNLVSLLGTRQLARQVPSKDLRYEAVLGLVLTSEIMIIVIKIIKNEIIIKNNIENNNNNYQGTGVEQAQLQTTTGMWTLPPTKAWDGTFGKC